MGPILHALRVLDPLHMVSISATAGGGLHMALASVSLSCRKEAGRKRGSMGQIWPVDWLCATCMDCRARGI